MWTTVHRDFLAASKIEERSRPELFRIACSPFCDLSLSCLTDVISKCLIKAGQLFPKCDRITVDIPDLVPLTSRVTWPGSLLEPGFWPAWPADHPAYTLQALPPLRLSHHYHICSTHPLHTRHILITVEIFSCKTFKNSDSPSSKGPTVFIM